ncbi:Transcriptional regulatory protein ZraR [Stieleria neptunia]|uniref:Transcriptional regulatory protein ZraR n=1 Tax=Stieleria neptunia TaxID=2527979 RepID=A0A518HZJ2_9BACT|nr:response regulator [Stieleria neptunia]QDV46271.1 Transcriptional regulatory protein ZraR [Stieleria neptunia]
MTTILVVDDSRVDQTLVQGILSNHHDLDLRFANHGAEAMQSIQQQAPDLVVTDLMMPEMDGLQLVRRIRQDRPEIPVIVMTAMGSATNAVEALEVGAASFVPKLQLTERLSDTVRQVLMLKHAVHPYGGVVRCLADAELTFHLRSDIDLIPQFVDLVQRTTSGLAICDATEAIRISLALEEALLNALVHGNFELTAEVASNGINPSSDVFCNRSNEPPYCDRIIFVQLRVAGGAMTFVIRDEGPGFDVAQLPDENDLTPFDGGIGRGIRLMRSFMDKVSFNAKGNEVTLMRDFRSTADG